MVGIGIGERDELYFYFLNFMVQRFIYLFIFWGGGGWCYGRDYIRNQIQMAHYAFLSLNHVQKIVHRSHTRR